MQKEYISEDVVPSQEEIDKDIQMSKTPANMLDVQNLRNDILQSVKTDRRIFALSRLRFEMMDEAIKRLERANNELLLCVEDLTEKLNAKQK